MRIRLDNAPAFIVNNVEVQHDAAPAAARDVSERHGKKYPIKIYGCASRVSGLPVVPMLVRYAFWIEYFSNTAANALHEGRNARFPRVLKMRPQICEQIVDAGKSRSQNSSSL